MPATHPPPTTEEQTLTDQHDQDPFETSAAVARRAAAAADAKQGSDIVILGVGEVLAIVDWFVIVGAGNPRQVRTIAEEVELQIKEAGGGAPLRVEGLDDARWVLLDYGDVAVHVFLDEAREYYDLERLWGDVRRLDWAPPAEGRQVAGG